MLAPDPFPPFPDTTLAALAHEHGPLRTATPLALQPILKGGSLRRFYRITPALPTENKPAPSLILVHYSPEKRENALHPQISAFLESLGLRVPHIHHHDPARHLIWTEDIGAADLLSHRHDPWPARRHLYRAAIDQILLLQTWRPATTPVPLPDLEKTFDPDLYLWEQRYFIEHCLHRHFNLPETHLQTLHHHPFLHHIAQTLGAAAPVLVHRDYQSTNILVRDNQVHIIDFQGLRLGRPSYDIASLLHDPYANLAPDEIADLLQHYLAGRRRLVQNSILPPETPAQAEDEFHLCSLQRLMQALGAYGFLGHTRHQPAFLQHIPTALRSLRQTAHHYPPLADLLQILDTLPSP